MSYYDILGWSFIVLQALTTIALIIFIGYQWFWKNRKAPGEKWHEHKWGKPDVWNQGIQKRTCILKGCTMMMTEPTPRLGELVKAIDTWKARHG